MSEKNDTLVLSTLLRTRRVLIVALTIGGAVTAWAASSLIRPLWEATGVIRVAHVPLISLATPGPTSNLPGCVTEQMVTACRIEPLGRVIDRVKSSQFIEDALSKAPLSPDQRVELARAAQESIAVKVLPRSELLEVKLRHRSADSAVRSLELIGTRLSEVHASMAAAVFGQLEREYDLTREMIAELSNLARLANKAEQSLTSRGGGPFDLYVFKFLEIQRRDRLSELDARAAILGARLRTRNSVPTSYLSGPTASTKPVVPQTWTMVVFGASIGFVLGLAITLFSDSPFGLKDDARSTRSALR